MEETIAFQNTLFHDLSFCVLRHEFSRFFETWEQTFEKVKIWTLEKGKIPTRHSNKELYNWLCSQRIRFKNNRLNKYEINQLKSIEFDLEGKGNEKKRDRWLEMYDNLVAFKKDNPDSWPKFTCLPKVLHF